MTSGDEIRYSASDSIATIILNRPERMNAFTLSMVDAWAGYLDAAASDDSVHVVVITGAGRAFCSGIDLDTFRSVAATPMSYKRMLMEHVHRVPAALDRLDKPVVAAINGAAVGAGMDMALLADMRIMARSAKLSERYIKLGLVPGDGAAWLLTRLVGTAKAMELLLTGAFIDSEEAYRLGIVNQVVDDGDVLDYAYGLARTIAEAPPVQVSMIRRLVRGAERIDLQTHYDLVSSHFAVAATLPDRFEAEGPQEPV